MLSYRKLAMRVLGRPLHTEGIDSPRPASQRAAALVLTAAMLTTLAAPAFAKTWYIENGNITVKAGKIEGTNKVSQGETTDEKDTDTVITNRDKDTASSHTVTINANGKNDKVEVTLKDVNIEANSGPALTSKGDVTLTLKGENHLTGGNGGRYGGSGITEKKFETLPISMHGFEQCISMTLAPLSVLYLEYAPVKKRAPRKTTAAKSTTTKKAAVKPKKTVIRTESAAKPTASVSARKKKATKSESV